ncbi:MAG TPA: OmpA family protein [Methylomirabilota bacterium]|jgi:outer membrane protein OmpA-like peptidoglycan-associated protein|nr:OmpA family protein [Methylomirabilota bacterium]
MKKTPLMREGAVIAALALVVGCSQPLTTREKGTLVGGGIGAATGAIIGSAVGNPGAGAAIGGALGAGAGALVGDQLQKRDTELAESQKQIEQQQQEIARNRELIEELKKQNLEARETDRGVVVNLPDVLFEFGKANLTGDARSKIRGISEVLNNQARGRRISVEGHTDSIGSEAFNQRLSERRANTVAAALETEGVNADRIVAKGFGERYPVAPNTINGVDNPEGRAKNRRVEVIIENK